VQVGPRGHLATPVEVVPCYGVGGVLEVNADLVRAPGQRERRDQREITDGGDAPEVCPGFPAALVDPEAPGDQRVRRDGLLNHASVRAGVAEDNCEVALLYLPGAPGLIEAPRSLAMPGEEQDAARDPVETVEEPEPDALAVAGRESKHALLSKGHFVADSSPGRLCVDPGRLVDRDEPSVIEEEFDGRRVLGGTQRLVLGQHVEHVTGADTA
jgi:hypothetical protein